MEAEQTSYTIVCFGGSAGATVAYADVLRHLPPDTGMAFIIVPHRALTQPFQLPQVLERATSMTVIEIRDHMLLEPNHVFVLPPGFDMQLTMDGHLHLTPARATYGWPTTLSTFLISLAENAGQRAVVVIFSGMGNDGCSGLAAIKAAGGLTFAQCDAVWDEMPVNAIATGNIDFQLSAADIAHRLTAHSLKKRSQSA